MKTKLLSIHLIIFNLCTLGVLLQGQNIIRIPSDYPTIQQGLDAANTNTTILVSPGIYYENLIWPSKIDSIKLIGIEGSAKTIIDGNYKGTVITIINDHIDTIFITGASLLQGFTIQHGRVFDNFAGGGLYCYFTNPTLNDLSFTNNQCSNKGGGASLYYYSGTIENCQFIDNKISSTIQAVGTGLSINLHGNLILRNCTFHKNIAQAEVGCYGGGLALEHIIDTNDQNVYDILISNCKFLQNEIHSSNFSNGAGLYAYSNSINNKINYYFDSCLFYQNKENFCEISGGGAMHLTLYNSIITNCKFIENKSDEGAGIYFSSVNQRPIKSIIKNTTFSRNQTYNGVDSKGSAIYKDIRAIDLNLTNVMFENNQSSAIYISDESSNIEMYHCTSFNNELNDNFRNAYLNAQNSVYWTQQPRAFSTNSSKTNLNHCIVKGGFPGIGILDKDPLMLNANLPVPGINSPCLNAGVLIPDITTDINGFPRPMPINSLPDIGAYEMDQYFAHVLVKYYYDINQNGMKDINERYLSFGSVKDHNDQTHVNYSVNGTYVILQQGMASIQYVEDISSEWKSSGQNLFRFNVNSAQFSEKIEIGIYPRNTQAKLSTMVFGNNFRCGEEVKFTISLTNYGTTIESGYFWLKIDNRLDSIWFTDLPDEIISKHEFSWRYQDLYPGESITKKFFVLAPRINNPNELGEIYKFCHGVSGLALREDDCYLAELRCSFDPNDKFASPQREDHLSLLSEPLIYTIRFQNTGNDYARNVIIRDQLDPGFNINTLKILHTSHPEILKVLYDDLREVVFHFQNIFLPDSTTDYEGSNGHVTYSIEYIDGIVPETRVENTAHIYFDFNPAIVTNTTHNIVVLEFPTLIVDPDGPSIHVSPNPAINSLVFSQIVDKCSIFDINGTKLAEAYHTNTLGVQFPFGTYLLKLEYKGKVSMHKILIINR
ncbi:MAG: hypothetical protein IPM48_00180 [Saprospiraceae bacterium]|nr:hypothetical protein [Saprospiraceae bacterium]